MDIHLNFVLEGSYYRCKICSRQLTKPKDGSTSSRRKHLSLHLRDADGNQVIPLAFCRTKSAAFIPPPPKQPKVVKLCLNEKGFHRNILYHLLEFGIPFEAVESESFRNMFKGSGGNVQFPTVDDLYRLVSPSYLALFDQDRRSKVAGKKGSLNICFKENIGIASLIFFYIDHEFVLRRERLPIYFLQDQATTSDLDVFAEIVQQIQDDFLCSISAVTFDKTFSRISVPSVPCFSEILNLVLKSLVAVPEVSQLVGPIIDLAVFFAGNQDAQKKLTGFAPLPLKIPASMGWLSLIYLLEAFNADISFVAILPGLDEDFHDVLKKNMNHDKDLLGPIINAVKFLHSIANMAEDSPCSIIPALQRHIQHWLTDTTLPDTLSGAIKASCENFFACYAYNPVVEEACFFDPRFAFSLQIYSAEKWQSIMGVIEERLARDYSHSPIQQTEDIQMDGDWNSTVENGQAKTVPEAFRNDVESYRTLVKQSNIPPFDPTKPIQYTFDDVQAFWATRGECVPILAAKAQLALSIRAASTEQDRVFKKIGHIVGSRHRFLSDERSILLDVVRQQMEANLLDIPVVSDDYSDASSTAQWL